MSPVEFRVGAGYVASEVDAQGGVIQQMGTSGSVVTQGPHRIAVTLANPMEALFSKPTYHTVSGAEKGGTVNGKKLDVADTQQEDNITFWGV